MDLPLRKFTVMSVIEDANHQTWLLLRESQSQYYCEAETEKVNKLERTELENKILNSGRLKEETWIGSWEMAKTRNFTRDQLSTINRVPYCV